MNPLLLLAGAGALLYGLSRSSSSSSSRSRSRKPPTAPGAGPGPAATSPTTGTAGPLDPLTEQPWCRLSSRDLTAAHYSNAPGLERWARCTDRAAGDVNALTSAIDAAAAAATDPTEAARLADVSRRVDAAFLSASSSSSSTSSSEPGLIDPWG